MCSRMTRRAKINDYVMKKVVSLVTLIFIVLFLTFSSPVFSADKNATFWEFQSIDTMKYSRDLARQKLNDPDFDKVIDEQIKNIAQVGATHVAISTPYNEEFLPILRRWVKAARDHNLKVWFRGNFAGWEKWFDYQKIDRKTHLEKTKEFILENHDLFEDGDVFTACPECENGGPGDPRKTGDVSGYRKFLIDEYKITKAAFREIGKNVTSNFDSMNMDVAMLVMDKETTQALGGVVTVDHYVAKPEDLVFDLKILSKVSEGKIVLGEFGAPIKGLHGQMSEKDQALWIEKVLAELVRMPDFKGVNYWVNVGGSTEIWNVKGDARQAAETIKKFYQPAQIKGVVKDELGKPVKNAAVFGAERKTTTDSQGQFTLPYLKTDQTLKISASGYKEKELKIVPDNSILNINFERENQGLFLKIRIFFENIWSKLSYLHIL